MLLAVSSVGTTGIKSVRFGAAKIFVDYRMIETGAAY